MAGAIADRAAREVTDAALREVADMRGRLASITQTATQPPPPAAPPPPPAGKGTLPVVPGVPQKVIAALYPLLASGRTSAAAAGLALGVSKTVAYEYLTAMRTYGYAEVTGGGRSSGWQLPERPKVPEDKRAEVDRHIAARETISRYDTLEDLAQAAHDGLVFVRLFVRGIVRHSFAALLRKGWRTISAARAPVPSNDSAT